MAIPKRHIIGITGCAVMTAIVAIGITTNPSFNAWLTQRYIERASTGSDNTCPICSETFNFMPFGEPKRNGAYCGRCGSLKRHRLLYIYLKDNTNRFTDYLSLLHIRGIPCYDPKKDNDKKHGLFNGGLISC